MGDRLFGRQRLDTVDAGDLGGCWLGCRRVAGTGEVHVVGNDTLVESPLVIRHLRNSMERIGRAAQEAGLPIRTRITRPHIDQTFWVNVIGRGYIPPTRNFRWCTDRMKILPTGSLLEGLVKRHGRAVLLVGTRKSESEQRRRNMAKRRVSGTKMNAHGRDSRLPRVRPARRIGRRGRCGKCSCNAGRRGAGRIGT